MTVRVGVSEGVAVVVAVNDMVGVSVGVALGVIVREGVTDMVGVTVCVREGVTMLAKDTAVPGAVASIFVPTPSWPDSPSPQHLTMLPVDTMAHVV